MMRPMAPHLRIARPVTHLASSVELYSSGLGFTRLGHFEDHEGFDGAMLGQPGASWHFEFTQARHHPVPPTPTPEDLVVLYLPDVAEWRVACERMLHAGFQPVTSFNPYWDERGRTFADQDGYRVVLQNAGWHNAEPA